jgi:tRNA (guanine37-N1)-methyltransferase
MIAYDYAFGLRAAQATIGHGGMMRIDILTLFPGMFTGPMTESMLWKARDRGLLDLRLHDIRDHSTDKHRAVDDTPYGGGGGMVMKADVVVAAVESVLDGAPPETPVVLMTPQGRLFSHEIAVSLAQKQQVVILCGHYEGIDERVTNLVVTDEISIGDYVLTGGELAAMVLVDAVVRHIPGVLGAEGAAERDSHADGVLEGPQYTRPPVFRGLSVPTVLQEGHHESIMRWRREEGLRRTWQRRPDLLLKAKLTEDEKYLLAKFAEEEARRTNN